MESYSNYDALWPLMAMGVRNDDQAPNGWSAVTSPARRTRVAIIDTSVAVEHPNLKDAVNRTLAFDLFSTRLGAFPYRLPKEKIGPLALNTTTTVATGLQYPTELLAELIDRLSPDSTAWIGKVQPMVSAEFSTHGTAISGIVGARATAVPTAPGYPSPVPGETFVPLPFCGVDPNCEIVPISTNFVPSPESLIIAFLYAELIDADVILVPRTISDPSREVPELTRMVDGKMLRDLVAPTTVSPEEAQGWEELAQLILSISLRRPVVCAGGNGNEEHGIYPANLASDHNGIISVGAVNAKGFRSSYSSSRYLTVMGPSDDGETFDRNEVRLNEMSAEYSGIGMPASNSNFKFSRYEVISTDVPGMFGYSRSPFITVEPSIGVREFGSYFCRFGGTSAASAFVAGFLALGKSAGQLALDADGLEAKAWLLSRCLAIRDGEDEYRFPSWDGQERFPDGGLAHATAQSSPIGSALYSFKG